MSKHVHTKLFDIVSTSLKQHHLEKRTSVVKQYV